MKKVWSADGLCDQIDSTARIVSLDGDYVLEVLVRNKVTFFHRVLNCIKYLFKKNDIVLGSFFLSSNDISSIRGVGDDDITG